MPTLPPQAPGSQIPLRHAILRMADWLYLSFVVAPLATLLCLYGLSWRFAAFLGHWPRPLVDDPKFVGPGDPLTNGLYLLVIPLLLWSLPGVAAVPLLGAMLRRRYAWWLLLLGAICFFAGYALLWWDPHERLRWYMD